MKGILIDENLPASLGKMLGEQFEYVSVLGSQPTDEEIWEHARKKGLVILTKDADFFDKLALSGGPPKIVWFRTGNLRRVEIENLAVSLWPKILRLLASADLVEVHPTRLEAIKF